MAKTVTELLAEIDAQLPTTGAGLISAATLRAVLDDVVNNFQVTAGRINTTSGGPDNTTVLYGDNTWKVPTVAGGGIAGNYLTANASVAPGTINYCDTSGGGFGVTIPPSPVTGNVVSFRDALGTWGAANLTINPGVNSIDGTSGSLTCDSSDTNFDLIWRGGSIGWSTQFVVTPLSRKPAVLRSSAGAAQGAAIALAVGRGFALIGAGQASGVATVTGRSSASTLVTLNPSDKSAAVTLSGGNLTGTLTTNTPNSGVRGTLDATVTGNKYYEATIVAQGSGFTRVGVGSSLWTLGTALAADELTGSAMTSYGFIEGPGKNNYSGTEFTVGDVLGVFSFAETTTSNGGCHFYLNGNWQGFVASRLQGADSVFPAISFGTLNDSVTFNFGATPFVYTLPSGASPWNA